jgi:hypothetical protein
VSSTKFLLKKKNTLAMPLLLVKSMTGDITDLFLLPQLTEKEFVDFIRKDHPLSLINV